MKSTTWKRGAATVGLCLFTTWATYDAVGALAAQWRATPSIARIYSGADGETHAQELPVRLTFRPEMGRSQSDVVKVTSSYVVRFPAGYAQEWHPAPARRYVVTLSGQGEIGLAGGKKITLKAGDILQAEDLTGKGHITRTIGKEDWTALFVQFDE